MSVGGRRFLGAAALLACMAAFAGPAAAAGQRHPSARELWRQYPLGTGTPQSGERPAVPTATVSARVVRVRRVDSPARTSGGGFDPAWIVVAVLLAVAAVPGWMLFGRRPREERAAAPAATPPPPAPDRPRAACFTPPAHERGWTAEITWRRTGAECRFSVTAVPVEGGARRTVAESAPLEWPPAGPAAVQAMTDAVEALERSLLTDGWRPLPPGEAWYAKRFASPPATERRAPGREHAGATS